MGPQMKINRPETFVYIYLSISIPSMLLGLVLKIDLLFVIGAGLFCLITLVGFAFALYGVITSLLQKRRRHG